MIDNRVRDMTGRNMDYRIAAAILVGGRSKRMGSPKEKMVIKEDGRTFLDKICDEADACRGICLDAFYMSVRKGQKTGRKGYIEIEDEYDDIVPMGCIFSVLERASKDGIDAVLFLACDMIKYDKEEISFICGAYQGEDILWARTDGDFIQPLASIYSVGIVGTIRDMADKGDYKLRNMEQYLANIGYCDRENGDKYENVNSYIKMN